MSRPGSLALAMLVLLATLPGVVAAETRTGGTVVVDANETVEGGLETFAGSVVVRGTVRGGLEAVAGDVRVAESGTVTGDVQASGGSIVIAGAVGGNVEAGGGSVEVREGGRIDGSIEAGAGSILIDGTVAGDATLGADRIQLGPSASIGGDLTYDGTLVRDEGAAVEGTVTRDADLGVDATDPVPDVPGALFGVYAAIVNLLVGALLLLVFPDFSDGVAERVADDPVWTGLVGLLTVVVVPLVLLVLLVTVVGIPLSVAGFVLFGVFAWIGSIYGRYAVGAWLLSLTDSESRWLALVVGVLGVALLTAVPIVGGLVELVVSLLGIGAIALGVRTRYRGRGGEAGATPAAADAA